MIGLLCLPDQGHLLPFLALARALARRGRRVVWFSIPDRCPYLAERGQEVHVIGGDRCPSGWLDGIDRERRHLVGHAAQHWTLARFAHPLQQVALHDALPAIAAAGCTGLITDSYWPGAGTVAQALRLPAVACSGALAQVPDELPPDTYAPYAVQVRALRHRWYAQATRPASWWLRRSALLPLWRAADEVRRRHGLPPQRRRADDWPDRHLLPYARRFEPLADLLPGTSRFHGPLTDAEARPTVDFPWQRLDGRPLIYASLGTLVNGDPAILHAVATACAGLSAQLVLSLGRRGCPVPADLPGDPLVVDFAPQLELLDRAALVITHAGLNTTTEALARGVPLVALPITYDQPAVAARITVAGCGCVVLPGPHLARDLAQAVRTTLAEPAYARSARAMAEALRASGGTGAAAAAVEELLDARSA